MNRIKYRLKGALAMLLCVVMLVPQVAQAVWDPTKATRIDPKSIESSTIAIGTQLIHISAMTDELYSEALLSAATSGQNTVYYKSELAGGDWFDVTGASSIADISTGGIPVPNKTLAELYFTHHTRSDGLTYDLRTNSVVHAFDIRNPYEFGEMDELIPYNNQEDYVRQSPMYRDTYHAMTTMSWFGRRFISSPQSYPYVTNIWNNMATMDDYQKYLRQNNASPDELNIVQQAIGYQDAERRHWLLSQIDSELLRVANSLVAMNDAKAAADASEDDDDDENVASNIAPQSVLDAIGESQMLIKSSIIKMQSKKMSIGSMVAEQYRYNFFNDLIRSTSVKGNYANNDGIVADAYGVSTVLTREDFARFNNFESRNLYFILYADVYYNPYLRYDDYLSPYLSYSSQKILRAVGMFKLHYSNDQSYLSSMDSMRKRTMGVDYPSANKAVANLINLERISNSDIVNRADELALLTGFLTPSATSVYLQRLKAGLNYDYRVAVQDKSSQAMFNSIIENNTSTVGSAQTELEYFLEEMVDRMSRTDGLALLDKRLTEARGYYKPIPKDDFQAGANASVGAHIEFLTRLRSKVQGEDSSELSKLSNEKSSLQTELMDALDNNLLDVAEELRDRIAAIDDKVNSLDADQAAEQAELTELIEDLEGQLDDANGAGNADLADQLGDLLGDARAQLAGLGSGGGTLSNLAAQLKKDGLAAIAGGDTSGTDNSLSGLIGIVDLDARLAYPAISSLRDAMRSQQDTNGTSTFGSQIVKAEQAMKDSAGKYESAMRAGKGGSLERAREMVSDYDPSQNMDNAAMAGALGQLADDSGDDALQKLLADLMDKLFKDGNPYVYIRYDDGVNEYIPCNVLCYYTGMRYVWQQSERTGTMSKKGNYYSFLLDSTKVNREKNGTKTDQMTQTAKWKDTVHVYEGYTMEQFDAEAYYVPGTQYGVLLTPEMKALLTEILGTLKGGN